MSFAAFDFLCGVITAWTALFGSLDALTVNDTQRGFRVAAFLDANLFTQGFADLLPKILALPLIKVLCHQFPGRKIVRKIAPLAPRPFLVQDSIDNFSSVVFGNLRARLWGRNPLGKNLPLGVGQVRP